LAQELMRIRPDIPVILCTGFSERITKEKAESLGIREILLKPLVMNDLARVINRVIYQNKKGG
jgi:CheY-like chemotaxis protein